MDFIDKSFGERLAIRRARHFESLRALGFHVHEDDPVRELGEDFKDVVTEFKREHGLTL